MEITRQMKMRLASNTTDIQALRGAGYSASALRGAGYSASALRGAGYSASALRGAGYSASDVLGAGYSASALRGAGYSASDVRGAGYSASALRGAGYSASDVRGAGYSASDVREMEKLEARIPLLVNPYSQMMEGIRAGQRCHKQSTFGPDTDPATNLCKTAMCTAGHLVQMGGAAGYDLKNEFGFASAAQMIHAKAHPGWPCQDFGNINQDWAFAYIEEMADWEANGVPDEFKDIVNSAA